MVAINFYIMIDSIIFVICLYLIVTNKFCKLYIDEYGVDLIVTQTDYTRIKDKKIKKETYLRKINLVTFKANS